MKLLVKLKLSPQQNAKLVERLQLQYRKYRTKNSYKNHPPPPPPPT